ncbi:hypothetical protein [Zunongwangia sp.]|uniref:hypothetical protein n=1 Tax=Zunongwangia sp. TaxID=1965325 RepID=UPI003AA95562
MTEDKNLKGNLEYLDNVLSYFINTAQYYQAHLDDISQNVFDLKLNKIDKPKPVNTFEDLFSNYFSPDNKDALFYKVRAAIKHLVDNGYIILEKNDNIKLTYKGIIKYS